ncbi:MAG: hypothetical protein U9R34_04980 [Nanoarchaeota archaeon]|nr:hypothetical protein [Nanoarchaeota archaeon]
MVRGLVPNGVGDSRKKEVFLANYFIPTNKFNSIITSESDLKCYFYSKIKENIGNKFFIKKYGVKYPGLITEIDYSSAKIKKKYIADLILFQVIF